MERFQLKPTIYFGPDALAALDALAGKRVMVITDAFLSSSGLLDRVTARLTGCKNILPCTRVGEHPVHLAGWEQPLTVALPVPEDCRAVGIRAHDFAPCAPGTPNSLPVQAVSTSENPLDWNMIFTLPFGETRLWWKVSKETLAAPPPKAPACLAAAPENIMPLV